MEQVGKDKPGQLKWLVMFASFGLQISAGGISYNTGLYYIIFKENIPGSSTSISLAPSMALCLMFALGKYDIN